MEQMTTMTALAILSAALGAVLSNEPKPGSVLADLQKVSTP